MTWAQGTFAFCFGILVPMVGLVSAMRHKREGKSRFNGFVLGSGAMFLALAACSLLAILCFPKYPRQEVPELLANAFTLPGLAAAIAVIWLVPRKPIGSLWFCQMASVIAVVLYLAGVALCYEAFTWPFRRALPWSAHQVHEWYWTDTLIPDYSYQLKAKITEEEFRRYVTRFGLTPHTTNRRYSDDLILLRWDSASGSGREWWDPSESLDSTFVKQDRYTWTFAKYEHGYLFLSSLAH
jgi:hypothetical protein